MRLSKLCGYSRISLFRRIWIMSIVGNMEIDTSENPSTTKRAYDTMFADSLPLDCDNCEELETQATALT